MAYGIHVENPSGNVQIDQDYTNYYLVATTSFAVTGDASYYAASSGTVAISGYTYNSNDLCAINTGSSSTSGYVRPITGGINYIIWSQTNQTIQVKIFRRFDSLTAAGTGFGLEVFKSDGSTLAFSSNYSYMNILGVISGNPPFSASFTPSDGSVPYITSNTGFTRAFVDPADGQFPGETEYQTVAATSTVASATYEVLQGGVISYSHPGTVQMLVVK